jgi:putative DNA primase/helicase
LLAFWTGDDGGRVDRLFRASRLYRAKWDEARGERTYGAQTIAQVLGGRR